MRILVDAMGGDKAPDSIVNGCMDAIKEQDGFEINLIGHQDLMEKIIRQRGFSSNRLILTHADEAIGNDESPTQAIKNKTKSSMVQGFRMLCGKEGDAFVSAGNSGALLAGSLLLVGRMDGVIRPALGAVIPTERGQSLLIDAGLNSECRPESYLQFAKFGAEYMKILYGKENPTIGLINIGTEDQKGTAEAREANLLLKNSNMNFYGNIEGNNAIEGVVDIMVCNGFIGNVLLKFLEGSGRFFMRNIKNILVKSIKNKLSALIIKKDLRDFARTVDPDILGGAPILGINELVIKSHGSSNAKTIKNVIIKAKKLSEQNIIGSIRNNLGVV
ncbi:MAG: phosphate acyltransferase PlsX [Clostridia bacterium]